MGLFFGKRKRRNEPDVSFEITASCTTGEISRHDLHLLRSGWKLDVNEEIHPPETVWVGPRSSVYHCSDCCRGVIIASRGIQCMPESKAIRLGYTRCSRCDWGYNPWI